jgi:hypothetical protein
MVRRPQTDRRKVLLAVRTQMIRLPEVPAVRRIPSNNAPSRRCSELEVQCAAKDASSTLLLASSRPWRSRPSGNGTGTRVPPH